ncbi:MAG TPA: hypothetical protein VKF40_30850 [Burkholderiales bacterium]|nr:hypothetical protein [Burkholderiales bacterium]
MRKLLSAVALFLMPAWALAAVNEQVANAPAEQVDTIYVVIFGVLFFGLIIMFFVWMWWDSKKKKPD